MDVHDSATRSYNMSRIKATNTKPEIVLRKLLWLTGLRGYRLHLRLPGRPDIAFTRKKVAVFVDGCFWHSCPHCGDGRSPTSNTGYWSEKLRQNRERDARNTLKLEAAGWKVIRFWEHELTRDPVGCALHTARVLGVDVVSSS
ncbi:MAG: mismatch endonuclease, patch repair protein [Thermoanaerobaculia bacterium]|jgi:DNA mismatch endonuclease (patch repair protein)|nr:mismatch endonuclease, patch repair protein [Thermoanaerobaculia bacterium]